MTLSKLTVVPWIHIVDNRRDRSAEEGLKREMEELVWYLSWYTSVTNPRSCQGCQCSAMLHLLLYAVKRQLTICFKSSKPIKLACVCWCLWASTSTTCISMPSVVRHDICRDNYAVERGLVVSFCGQSHYCYRSYYPTARFPSPSSYMVYDEPFPDRSRPMSC